MFARRGVNDLWYYVDRKTKPVSDPLYYRNLDMNTLCLQLLAEYGLDHSDSRVDASARSFLSCLQARGYFSACRGALLLHVLVMLGYSDHPYVEGFTDHIRREVRWDNGQLCPGKKRKRKVKPVKSCVRATTKALLAFASSPVLRDSPEAGRIADYYLRRGVFYRTDDPTAIIQGEMVRTFFPFTNGRAGLLELVYGLSALGYGDHDAMQQAWTIIATKTDVGGKVRLDRMATILDKEEIDLWTDGEGGDKWATLYVMMAKKACAG